MDLRNYVKSLLSLFFVFWRNEFVHSLECVIGRSQQEKPNESVECLDKTDVIRKINNCQFLSCRKKEEVQAKIIDSSIGKLEIRFQGAPKHCNFQVYIVDLEIYDEETPYEEDLMCNTDKMPWVRHSRRWVENTICSNCTSQLKGTKCYQEHVTYFNYVYPGIYRVKVTPFLNGSTRQAQRSYRFLVNNTVTNYVKKTLVGLNLNASLLYRSVTQELDLGIPLLIEQVPSAVKIEVKSAIDYNVFHSIVIHSSSNSTDISCNKNENTSWPSCKMHQGNVSCQFYNLSPGTYNVYVTFLDERCARGSVWTINFTDACFWVVKKKDFIAEKIAQDLTPNEDVTTPHILYTSVIIILLIGAILASFIAKKISKRKEFSKAMIGKPVDDASKNSTEQTYNFNSGIGHRFNFGQFLTLTERPKPEVLLVCARETPPFMELVACLRRVITKIFKCVVYDYYDPDLWNEVSSDPKGWIQALIFERQAKIIIVASEMGALQYRSVMGECPQRFYKTPHPFDHLFSYAIRLIRDGINENSYKNLFVITFDGITDNSLLMEYLNPYTRFVLPKHLYKLFEHLHDPETFKCLDIHRLEEKHEVRQLRMQLDHLKNLKLFGDTDLNSLSMCG